MASIFAEEISVGIIFANNIGEEENGKNSREIKVYSTGLYLCFI